MTRPYLAAAVALFGIAPVVGAQSISPTTFSATMNVGQVVTINKTITLGASGANLIDLFFLADNTGSMGTIITNAKTNAAAILGALPAGNSYNFGVGAYVGDPSEGASGGGPPFYIVDQALTASAAAAQTGINAWFASGGGDTPEGNFFALQQVANTTAWRAGSQRIVVWFGDAEAHTETTTQAQAIAALQAKGIKVLAFNSLGAGSGIDQGGQATAIVAATSGTELNNFTSLSSSAFTTAVNNAISAASSTLNLVFGSTLIGSGLTLEFICTDILGCNNVAGGQTRSFQLKITANTPGTYDFSAFATGVSATELDHIVVTGATVTPEPSTWALLATGMFGLGLMARVRRRSEERV